MTDDPLANATVSAAAGGRAASTRPVPWFTPVFALVVGGVLVALTVIAFRWTVDADPGNACPGDLGVPALMLAGSTATPSRTTPCAR